MYKGPIIDAFFHPGWAATTDDTFGGRGSWVDDPMRARVMRTFSQGGEKPRTPEATMDDTVREMDACGVEKAVFQASNYYPASREDVERRVVEHHDIIRKFPGRFEHCGSVRPPMQGPGSYWDLMENPRLLAEHKEKYGIKGVHLLPSPWGTPPNDRWYYPLFAKCVELGLVVFTYVGMPGPLWPTYPNYPLHLDDVCIAFPDLVVVGHHIGDPWVEMMCHLSAKHPNLYITTSAWSPKRYPPELIKFMGGKWHGQAGADKVIFGTDYPLLNLEKAVNDARNLDLPTEVLEKFLYTNVKKIIPGL